MSRAFAQTVPPTRSQPQQRRAARGTAIVEFMIVAPFLLLLMFAGIELGRVVQQHETLIKTVRNSARYVVSNTTGSLGVVVLTPQLVNTAKNLTVYGTAAATGQPVLPGFSTGDVTVTDPTPGHIQVTANYTYQPLFGGVIPTFGLGNGPITLTLPMTASTVMRIL